MGDEREPGYRAREEVQVGHEPPATPPSPETTRPKTGLRLVVALIAAALAVLATWAFGEWIESERTIYLAPVLAAGVVAGILAGAIRDPIGRLLLGALSAAGMFVSLLLFDAPIFGLIVAFLMILPRLEAAFGLTRRVGGLFAPLREGFRRGVRDPVRGWVEPRRKVVIPVGGLLLIAFFAIVPFLDDWFEVPQWFAQATSGGALSRLALFALFALGLNVVVGFAGLLDLGYVAFWAIGSYTAAILTGAAQYTKDLRAEIVSFEDKPAWEPWMWLILLAAILVAVFAGVVLGSPTLRLRGDYLAIVTLGFGEIIRIAANNLPDITVGPRGISSIPHPRITIPGQGLENDIVWGTLIDVKYYWLLLLFVVLWVIAIKLLDNSRIGRAWVAIREDEVAAASMGVPVVKMKLAAFVIGASTAGVGGVIYAEQANFINPPTFDILNSILILCMVVIGGMGSIPGAILGAAAIILLPEVFREFREYRVFAFGVALVIVMIFRPQGLLPSKRRKAELRGGARDEQLYEAAQPEAT